MSRKTEHRSDGVLGVPNECLPVFFLSSRFKRRRNKEREEGQREKREKREKRERFYLCLHTSVCTHVEDTLGVFMIETEITLFNSVIHSFLMNE